MDQTTIGFSVKQVIETARKVTCKNIPVTITKGRAGDSAHLVANSKRAQESLGWQPQYADFYSIIRYSWQSFYHPQKISRSQRSDYHHRNCKKNYR